MSELISATESSDEFKKSGFSEGVLDEDGNIVEDDDFFDVLEVDDDDDTSDE